MIGRPPLTASSATSLDRFSILVIESMNFFCIACDMSLRLTVSICSSMESIQRCPTRPSRLAARLR
ncbi:hypothetical protein D9M69_625960 [compost metagenome]